jgi:hypothetical protein
MHKGDTNETRFWWDGVEHPSLATTRDVKRGGNGRVKYELPTFGARLSALRFSPRYLRHDRQARAADRAPVSGNFQRGMALRAHDLDMSASTSLIEFIVHFEVEPELGLDAERLLEVEGRVSRDAFLAADDFAHCLFGPADHFGERSLGQASRIELLPKDIARDCQDNRYAREFLRFHQW